MWLNILTFCFISNEIKFLLYLTIIVLKSSNYIKYGRFKEKWETTLNTKIASPLSNKGNAAKPLQINRPWMGHNRSGTYAWRLFAINYSCLEIKWQHYSCDILNYCQKTVLEVIIIICVCENKKMTYFNLFYY